jgi:hypothetical protein
MSRIKRGWFAVSLVLVVAFSAVANERKVERITVLKPAADAEVIRNFYVLDLQGGERKVATSAPKFSGAPRAEQAYEWTVDLERGTYTTRIVKPNEADVAMRERLAGEAVQGGGGGGRRIRTQSECSPYDTGDGWMPCEDETRTQGWQYAYALETRYLSSWGAWTTGTRTEGRMKWKQCSGSMKLDQFNGYCNQNNPWGRMDCDWHSTNTGLIRGTVSGVYVNFSVGDSTRETYVVDEVTIEGGWGSAWPYADFLVTGEQVPISGYTYETPLSYYQAYCGSGTGGGGTGGDSGGGTQTNYGSTYCVSVYDGTNGAKLGDCCGTNNTQIIDCAKSYLH